MPIKSQSRSRYYRQIALLICLILILKILHMHVKYITYHNWLAEILVHCCPPQGREVYTVEGGLVPEGTGRSVDSHF